MNFFRFKLLTKVIFYFYFDLEVDIDFFNLFYMIIFYILFIEFCFFELYYNFYCCYPIIYSLFFVDEFCNLYVLRDFNSKFRENTYGLFTDIFVGIHSMFYRNYFNFF